jgi:hypothetical protein
MKKMIVLMLAMVFLSLNGTAFAVELPQATKVKTHTAYWWFNLPDDGWNWPLYRLDSGNYLGHIPATIVITLKDWQFKPLEIEIFTYIINPGKSLDVTLNDLWPSYFDYNTGYAKITDYIIEIKVTEQKIDEYFYVWPEIDACGNPNSPMFDPNGLGTDCYARYFGIIFLKLPSINLNK